MTAPLPDGPARAFADGPADPALAAGLAALSPAALDALVAALTAERRRAHLEALGEADALPRAVRKAARKAAYRLKSAGVEGEVAPRHGAVPEVSQALGLVASVMAPGLEGATWLATAQLPGADGVSVTCDSGGRVVEVTHLEGMGRARLRSLTRDAIGRSQGPHPVLCGADVAVRLLDAIDRQETAAGRTLPAAWSWARLWRDAALAAGADPEAASAGARLPEAAAAEAPPLDLDTLLGLTTAGAMTAPRPIYERLDRELMEVLRSPLEISEEVFAARLDTLVDAALDGWVAEADDRERLATWLDLDADVLLAAGQEPAARAFLWYAAALRRGARAPHELPLLRRVVARTVDAKSAWGFREVLRKHPDARSITIGPDGAVPDDD